MSQDQPNQIMELTHKQRIGRRLAILGLILQAGIVFGIVAITSEFRNLQIPDDGRDPGSHVQSLGYVAYMILAGFGIALAGVVLMLVSILECDYRRPWVYVVLMILSGLTALNYPWGTLIGVPLLVFLIIHFTKYRATSLERAVMEEE